MKTESLGHRELYLGEFDILAQSISMSNDVRDEDLKNSSAGSQMDIDQWNRVLKVL